MTGFGSLAIAERKARAAAKFRRETKAFEAGVQAATTTRSRSTT